MKKATLLSLSMMLGLVQTQAQTPFPVGTNVAIAKPGMNSAAKNYTIYTSTVASSATFTPGFTFVADKDINGIGINPTDNFVYGAAYVGADNTVGSNTGVSLRRVGQDGTVVDLGLLPTTGLNSIEFANFAAGTVSATGAYYYLTFGLKGSGVAKVLATTVFNVPLTLDANDLNVYLCWKNNISSLTANPGANIAGGLSGHYQLDFSNPDVTAAINAFLADVNANYPNVYNADGGVQDLAISPIDTKVYAYISYPSGGTTVGRPVVMNMPVAGVSAITPVGTTVNTVPGQEVAGVQFDAAGNFYGLFTTGHFAQISLTTGALSGVTMSNVTTVGGNLRGDLASAVTAIPLPVEIVAFTGKRIENANELTWITASEQNNIGFDVERSTDGKAWTKIGFVATQTENGNSNAKLSYDYKDAQSVHGTQHYRLKQISNDGKMAYSKVVLLTATTSGTITIYPNPANNQLNITGINPNSILRLIDINGRTVIEKVANSQVEIMNIANLPSNMYMLHVIENGVLSKSVKIIKN